MPDKRAARRRQDSVSQRADCVRGYVSEMDCKYVQLCTIKPGFRGTVMRMSTSQICSHSIWFGSPHSKRNTSKNFQKVLSSETVRVDQIFRWRRNRLNKSSNETTRACFCKSHSRGGNPQSDHTTRFEFAAKFREPATAPEKIRESNRKNARLYGLQARRESFLHKHPVSVNPKRFVELEFRNSNSPQNKYQIHQFGAIEPSLVFDSAR